MEPISITIAIAVVAGVVIVATFFVTRYIYKSKENRAVQRAETYKKQYEKEIELRKGLCQVAEQAGIDMQTLIELSQKHQEKFQQALKNLVHTIHESTETTEKLNQVALSIHKATEIATDHTEQSSEKFKIMQTALIAMGEKLSKTEEELAKREQELQETIAQLQSVVQVKDDQTKQQNTLNSFLEHGTFVCESLALEHAKKSPELHSLRDENNQLREKLNQLSHIVSQLESKMSQANTEHERSIQIIQSLLAKNTQLIHKIEELTGDLENQNTTYQPRLFK